MWSEPERKKRYFSEMDITIFVIIMQFCRKLSAFCIWCILFVNQLWNSYNLDYLCTSDTVMTQIRFIFVSKFKKWMNGKNGLIMYICWNHSLMKNHMFQRIFGLLIVNKSLSKVNDSLTQTIFCTNYIYVFSLVYEILSTFECI